MTNRKMKPGIYKIIMAAGIIGTYTAGFGITTDTIAATVIGTLAVFTAGIVGIDEETKQRA